MLAARMCQRKVEKSFLEISTLDSSLLSSGKASWKSTLSIPASVIPVTEVSLARVARALEGEVRGG